MADQYHWAGAAHLLLLGAEQLGIPRERLLAAAKLSAADIPPAPLRMDWVPLRGLVQAALDLTGDPGIGLISGLHATIHMQGVAAAYFMHMSPVRVSQECAYYLVWPKITNLLRYWHEESGDLALHCGGALVPGDPLVDVLVHVNLTEHITAYRALFGEATVIDHLAVRGISAADAERMSKLLGCRVVGGQPRTWLAMPKEILDRPLNYADPWLREQIRPQFEDFLRMLDDGRDATMAVRMAMDSELAAGRPVDLAALATVMRVKSRTLQARLAAEGTSFSRLLDQTRKDFALRQLAVPGTKAGAVATQCGFSDPAAFTRAFRRWTGSTPKAWLDKVEPHASG